MIPMECPCCGKRGHVPPDRLNSRLRCSKCDTVFHLDARGKVVLGEPGAKTKAPPRAKGIALDTSGLGDAFASLKSLPRWAKVVLAVVLVALAGYSVLSRLPFGNSGLPPGMDPNSLEGRTTLAGRAFVSNDTDSLRRMAAAGTEDALIEWYKNLRTLIGDHPDQGPGNQVIVAIMEMGHEEMKEGASNSAEAALIFPLKPGETKPETPFTLRLAWKCEGSRWRLDGQLMRDTTPKVGK
jgi:hypothetical protein